MVLEIYAFLPDELTTIFDIQVQRPSKPYNFIPFQRTQPFERMVKVSLDQWNLAKQFHRTIDLWPFLA